MTSPRSVTTVDGAQVPLHDVLAPRPVVEHTLVHQGAIWDLVRDRVDLGAGEDGRPVVVAREYVDHTGAVGVLVLDDDDRVLVLRQYRHPVRHELWEIPAGLLDVPGEDPFAAARRELAEEADLEAADWHVLVDTCTTPGGSTEALRVYLARSPRAVDGPAFAREHEERDMLVGWVPLDDVVAAVLAGDVHNPTICVGVLAAAVARGQDWATLRPADAPWPTRSPGRGRAADVPAG